MAGNIAEEFLNNSFRAKQPGMSESVGSTKNQEQTDLMNVLTRKLHKDEWDKEFQSKSNTKAFMSLGSHTKGAKEDKNIVREIQGKSICLSQYLLGPGTFMAIMDLKQDIQVDGTPEKSQYKVDCCLIAIEMITTRDTASRKRNQRFSTSPPRSATSTTVAWAARARVSKMATKRTSRRAACRATARTWTCFRIC